MPAGPSPSFFEKLFGKRTKNINLPNESGQVDERTKRVDVAGALREALEGYKGLKKNKVIK